MVSCPRRSGSFKTPLLFNCTIISTPHLEHGSLRLPQFIERRFSRRHLYDGAAQRPNVRRLAVSPRTLVYDLRSHVL